MDAAHIAGDMSPLYMPRKRKSAQSHLKGGSVSAVDVYRDQDTVKMKRTYGRKRYEDLQSGPVEYPTTSCSVMSSVDVTNGVYASSVAPPTVRHPPRLVAKDFCGPETSRGQSQSQGPGSWTGPGRAQAPGQIWTVGRDRAQTGQTGPDQAWAAGRNRGPEQGWAAGRDRNQDLDPGRNPGRNQTSGQAWESGRNQNRDQEWNPDRGHVWRPDLNMKKVQRAEMEPNPHVYDAARPPGGRNSHAPGLSEAPTARLSEGPRPPLLIPKKEPPSFPPGSPEERWQLQIAAKGRVSCPKCKSVSRKTVEGLKKHMENCRLQPFTCQHCGKQLRSSTGMKYHIMADHSHLPSPGSAKDLDDPAVKDKLRKILKRLGKLKCSTEGCSAAFTSIMGYVYHMKKCGKEESELEKLLLNCSHCGKAYRSKAGLEYHLRSEHAPTPQNPEEDEAQMETNQERTASGRVQRASAQVANFHLAEIANNDLPKDWPKRKFQSDLVPDDKKLKYSRPGLPAFSQEVLRKWKNEVKLHRKVQCPNQGCGCTYTSVSGLKAHLGLCTRGEFEAGKYQCLICHKEFNSESGVKYHINSVHSQDWFVTNKKATKKFEQFLKNQAKEIVLNVDKQIVDQYHRHHLHLHRQQQQQQHQQLHQHHLQPLHHLHLHQHHHHPQQQQQEELHYTSLEPPPPAATALWVDVPGSEQAPIEMEMDEMERPEEEGGVGGGDRVVEVIQVEIVESGKEAFGGGVSISSGSSNGSYGEAQVEHWSGGQAGRRGAAPP